MRRFVFVSVIAVCIAVAGALLAKTPDGQPPSKENPCAGLSRSAFGICNAYCEAQDCDVHPRPSCDKLRANWKKATGQDKLPCDRVACGDSAAPTCDGDCPDDLVCASGPELGGGEGGPDSAGPEVPIGCRCVRPLPACGGAEAPTCFGACPPDFTCLAGPEAGPEAGGSEGGCRCVLLF